MKLNESINTALKQVVLKESTNYFPFNPALVLLTTKMMGDKSGKEFSLPWTPKPIEENEAWEVYLPKTEVEFKALIQSLMNPGKGSNFTLEHFWNGKELIPYFFARKEKFANAGSFNPGTALFPRYNTLLALYKGGSNTPSIVYDAEGEKYNGFPTRDEILSMKFGKKLPEIPSITAISYKPNWTTKLVRYEEDVYGTIPGFTGTVKVTDDMLNGSGELDFEFTKEIDCYDFIVLAKNLKSFKGFPKTINGDFELNSVDFIEGCPSVVNGDFWSDKLTAEEIKKHCTVKGEIKTQ